MESSHGNHGGQRQSHNRRFNGTLTPPPTGVGKIGANPSTTIHGTPTPGAFNPSPTTTTITTTTTLTTKSSSSSPSSTTHSPTDQPGPGTESESSATSQSFDGTSSPPTSTPTGTKAELGSEHDFGPLSSSPKNSQSSTNVTSALISTSVLGSHSFSTINPSNSTTVLVPSQTITTATNTSSSTTNSKTSSSPGIIIGTVLGCLILISCFFVVLFCLSRLRARQRTRAQPADRPTLMLRTASLHPSVSSPLSVTPYDYQSPLRHSHRVTTGRLDELVIMTEGIRCEAPSLPGSTPTVGCTPVLEGDSTSALQCHRATFNNSLETPISCPDSADEKYLYTRPPEVPSPSNTNCEVVHYDDSEADSDPPPAYNFPYNFP